MAHGTFDDREVLGECSNVQVLAVEEKQCALSTATFKYLAIEYGSSDERGRRIQGDHSASSSSIIITEP